VAKEKSCIDRRACLVGFIVLELVFLLTLVSRQICCIALQFPVIVSRVK
jgi:hypothetical protein